MGEITTGAGVKATLGGMTGEGCGTGGAIGGVGDGEVGGAGG